MQDEVYVYGSNLAARFISESQHTALRWYNAGLGVHEGLSGDAYAIPLWDRQLRPLPMATVAENIQRFLAFATATPGTQFYVPRFTLDHRDFAERDIAKCFAGAPPNCHLPGLWQRVAYPTLVKLLLVARWADLSETDYELFYVWLHKYAKRLLTTPGPCGVWCVADPEAERHIGAWASKEGVTFHSLKRDRERYGTHAVTVLHERLLHECTDILAMESDSNYVKAVLTRASHLGLGARLIRKYRAPAAEHYAAERKPAPAEAVPHANPLRAPTAEDLQIHDPAGVYGSTKGTVPLRAARVRSEAEDHPFGHILEYAAGGG